MKPGRLSAWPPAPPRWASRSPATRRPRLIALLDRIALEPQNLTAIEAVDEGIDRHLLDSLVALGHPALAGTGAAVDVGSGAGFPGLALAVARPGLDVTLVESERRKADWLRRASAEVPNVRVVADRSEHLAGARAGGVPPRPRRALGPAPVALELPPRSWRSAAACCCGAATAPRPRRRPTRPGRPSCSASRPRPPVAVRPFPGARRRLQLFRKVAPTPERYPRRAGRAATRPLGAGSRR